MAESNPAQVILTDDGIKIIKAQSTADNATSGVADLNNPNLMNVIEKQNNIGQFAGLTSQYNVLVQNAKNNGIDTTAVTAAYNNLNQFMDSILADPNHASNVDRVAYKKYQDAYNGELSKLQNALQNNANSKFTSAASAATQAAATASQAYSQAKTVGSQASSAIAIQSAATAKAQSAANSAYSQAQIVGSQATSAIAVQSTATAKAQSTADSAFSQAKTAIDNGKVTSQAVTNLKDGSTLTIAQLGNGLASKVANSDFATYKTQTASQIGQMVTNGTFSAYQQTTADLISSKVATKDFSAYQDETAKAISSKVESSDFNTYKTQTDKLIGSKVDNGDFSTYKTQTANLIASKVADKDFETYKLQTADLISSKVATKDFNTYTSQTATAIDSKVANSDFNTYKQQTADAITSKVSTADFTTYQTQTAKDINLRVTKGDLIDQINIQAGNTLISSSGQLTLSGKTIYFDTANPVIIPSANIDTALINKQLTAANISANTFTTNNGTFTVDQNGAITANNMTLIGGTLTSPTINASTINTPNLNLGFNGTFTEDFDYTQATTMFLPKKNKGTLTFNHGVLQSKGNMQTYVGGQWGGMNSSYNFQAGIDNSQWTEVAPGYIKLDLFRQDDANFVERTYIDPTGYYYKSGNGIASYLGNVLQTAQVQTPSLIGKYIGPSAGVDLLQIGNNGKDYGLRIGNYYGGEAVLSDFIYNTTSSHSPDVHITENGRLVRTTSASKYKYNIKNPDIEKTLGDRLLNVHMATWNDKRAVDMYAEQLSTGEEREKSSIDKYYGLIAEQLRDAGLDMFINYGKNHEIEGIQYDRAWVPLLSVIRRLNDKVNEYELRLSKLEGANK